MSVPPAYLFVHSAIVATRRSGGEVLLEGPFADVRAEGVLAERLWQAFVDGAELSWAAAAGDGPLGRVLASLEAETPLPLEPAEALRLGRFGTLFIELVGRCNERCVHCYASSAPEVEEALTLEEVRQVLAEAAALGFDRVQLTGGEPLLCPFVVDAVAAARARGIASLEIFSNGTLLDDALLERLLPYEPDFAFSVYAPEPRLHDRITGLAGSWSRTCDAIRRVLGAGLQVRGAVTVMESNAERVTETIAWLQQIGVGRIDVSGAHAVGRGGWFSAEPRPGGSVGMAPHRGASPGEGRGTLCVTYRGDVVPCIFNRRDRLGTIRERSLSAIIRDPGCWQLASGGVAVERRLACAGCRLTHVALRRARGQIP